MTFTDVEARDVADMTDNQGVVSDTIVKLTASKRVSRKSPLWRRIVFNDPKGKEYRYLTNDLSL